MRQDISGERLRSRQPAGQEQMIPEHSERHAPRVPIFVNPEAGWGRSRAENLERTARTLGLSAHSRSVDPGDLGDVVRAAAARHAIVGVAGGDGSLRSAACALAGGETALLPIPAGTLNHFTRRLGIETPEEAFRALAEGHVRAVTLGVLDDELFLNTAVIGLYSDLVRRRERLRRWLTKWPAAVVSGCVLMVGLPLLEVTLELEGDAGSAGEELRRRTPLLWIGMGGGSFPFVHEAPSPRGGSSLEVAIIRTRTRRGVAWLGLRMIGRWLRGVQTVPEHGIELLQVRQLVLSAPGRVGVTLDGEPMRMTTPILVRVQDDCLRVVAPRPRSHGG